MQEQLERLRERNRQELEEKYKNFTAFKFLSEDRPSHLEKVRDCEWAYMWVSVYERERERERVRVRESE